MEYEQDERKILAYKLYQNSNPSLGSIRPIAEIINGKFEVITTENFCASGKVFITSHFDDIATKFENGEIFKISVLDNGVHSEKVDLANACRYVSQGQKAEKLKPKDLVEIIDSELPDCNDRRLSNIPRPGTRFIFLRPASAGGQCFGPFDWTSEESDTGVTIRLKFVTSPLPGAATVLPGQIYQVTEKKIESSSFSTTLEGRLRGFVVDLTVLATAEFYDFLSDEEIVKYCSASTKNGTRIMDTNKLTLLVSQAKANTPGNKARWARFHTIATNAMLAQEDIEANMLRFLQSESGINLIKNHVESNQPRYLESLKKAMASEISDALIAKKDELNSATERLQEINEQKRILSLTVEREREEAKKGKHREQANSDIDEKLRDKMQKFDILEIATAELSQKYEGLRELDLIRKKIDGSHILAEEQIRRKMAMERSIGLLRQEFIGAEDEIRDKLIKVKPLVEAINGSYVPGILENIDIKVEVHRIQADGRLIDGQKSVTAAVEHHFQKQGRAMQSWEVANLIISTQQSFLTFLAGLPGAGKTSLARLFASAQSLEKRIREVPVARGWTSIKDLVGFYNPLASRFQPSPTGLYSFLNAIEKESEQITDPAMAYILLDEANLSPIEHYWSAFMAMTDGEGGRRLILGQDTMLVPSTLRFIATINYDGTTEPLSPRIVDRSPIIVMETASTFGAGVDLSDTLATLPLSSVLMDDLFGCNKIVPEFEPEEKKAFEKVRDILRDPNMEKGRPVIISHRKEAIIRQYCEKARAIMREENDYLALDLAILQHVLPQVRGNGPKFAKRLDSLKNAATDHGLEKTAAYVDKMLAFGATELHSYDFFCW